MNWFDLNKKKLEYHSCDTIFLKDWMTYILYMNDNYINTYPCLCIYYHSVWYDRKSCTTAWTANFIQLFSDVLCISFQIKSQLWELLLKMKRKQNTVHYQEENMLYIIIYFQITNIASCPFCEILHLEWITKLSGFLQLDTIDRLVGTKIAFCHIE